MTYYFRAYFGPNMFVFLEEPEREGGGNRWLRLPLDAPLITPYNELFTVNAALNLETLIYWDLNFINNTNFPLLKITAIHNFKWLKM